VTGLRWEDIVGLYDLVLPIKCHSYVFASKMCHFLFPQVFMVMDSLATGIVEYEFYWRGMKDEWERYPKKKRSNRDLSEFNHNKPTNSL
jgi:hypothetical protein